MTSIGPPVPPRFTGHTRATRRKALPRQQGAVLRRAGVRSGERGSATVLMLAVIVVALTLALAAAALARAAHARGTAQAAADLAAIAAATAAQRPVGGDPCAVAAHVAAQNGARLDRCAVLAGGDVELSTSVAVDLGAFTATASAQARAGPVR